MPATAATPSAAVPATTTSPPVPETTGSTAAPEPTAATPTEDTTRSRAVNSRRLERRVARGAPPTGGVPPLPCEQMLLAERLEQSRLGGRESLGQLLGLPPAGSGHRRAT